MAMTDTATTWPAPFTSAVVVTVDYNDIHGILTQVPAMAGRDKSLSVWRYGTTRGVDRMLAIFAQHGIHASWCVPGIVAEENPSVIRAIHDAGHEIACAGYLHEDFSLLSREQQRASVFQGCHALKQVTGVRPKGFRTPAGSFAPGLADDLRAAGLAWSSSWGGDDLPYLHPPGEGSGKLVELPVHVELEDEPCFAFNLAPAVPASQARIASYADVLGNWQQDFLGFERFGLCYLMRLHPEMLGTVGRSGLLDEWLGWLKRQPGVWFATAQEVAHWWASQHETLPEDHPAAVFARHQQGRLA
jgi:hypothetical protein